MLFKGRIPAFKNKNQNEAFTLIGVLPNIVFFMHRAYTLELHTKVQHWNSTKYSYRLLPAV